MIKESVRTIRTLYHEMDKNQSLRKIMNKALLEALADVEGSCSEAQIDAIMSIVLESSIQDMSVGTPCINHEGKKFTILGLFDTGIHSSGEKKNVDHELYLNLNNKLYDNYDGFLSLVGLYYDPEKP